MTRLTRKVNYSGEYYGSPDGIPCDNLEHLEKVYTKLGQLEDIEEELGINLETLLKALKNRKIYVSKGYCTEAGDEYGIHGYVEIENIDYTQISQKELEMVEYFKDYANLWVFVFNIYEDYSSYSYLVRLKDYGKTWAFNEGELSKENK